MSNQLKHKLSQYWHSIQSSLFPWLEAELGKLNGKHRQLVTILEMVRIEEHVAPYCGRGRPPKDRTAIARSFIAKSVLNIPTTEMLLDRLRVDQVLRRICGWEQASKIPPSCRFSRAFAEFSDSGLCSKAHERLIRHYHADRLIGHISRDSTAIEAREAVSQNKPIQPVKPKRRRGRPKRGETIAPKTPTRIEKQLVASSVEEMLAEIPKCCDIGAKVNAKGYKTTWRGYKLHVDTADGDIPISCVISSASTHDSQLAIPLASMTSTRVTSCYDLMDSAYDSGNIRLHSMRLGHVPIIDFNRRSKKDTRCFMPHEAIRYRQRSSAERVNSRLKDHFGAAFIRVRGQAKVMTHLMFGILALTAEQTLRLAI